MSKENLKFDELIQSFKEEISNKYNVPMENISILPIDGNVEDLFSNNNEEYKCDEPCLTCCDEPCLTCCDEPSLNCGCCDEPSLNCGCCDEPIKEADWDNLSEEDFKENMVFETFSPLKAEVLSELREYAEQSIIQNDLINDDINKVVDLIKSGNVHNALQELEKMRMFINDIYHKDQEALMNEFNKILYNRD